MNLTNEEVQYLVDLLHSILLGPEHGVQTHDNWTERKRDLKKFLASKGVRINLPYVDGE